MGLGQTSGSCPMTVNLGQDIQRPIKGKGLFFQYILTCYGSMDKIKNYEFEG